MFIAKPRLGGVSRKPTIYLTRRMDKADGSFGGNTGAGLAPEYLSGFYNQIDLGPDAVVVLVGRDGVIRARQSMTEADMSQDLSQSSLFTTYLPQQEHGHFRAISPLDGVPRLLSYRALREYPLVVLVGTAEAMISARIA